MSSPVDLSFAIGLPPHQAVDYFRSKGYVISWNWYDTWQEAHAHAFTVAKAARADILTEIRRAVDKALNEGITFEQFRKELEPRLKAMGWWGKQWLGDESGQATAVQLGSVSRLKTIYRTNMQSAYMAGRWKDQIDNADDRPYLQYVAVLDSRTRPQHAALNGKVFPINDPFWDSFYPPLAFNCRCRVRSLNSKNLQDRSLTLSSTDTRPGVSSGGTLSKEDRLVSKTTGLMEEVTVYTDPATGKKTAPDPGWNYNPGKAKWQPDWSKYDSDIAAAVKKDLAKKTSVKSAFVPDNLEKEVGKDVLPDSFWDRMERKVPFVKGRDSRSFYRPASDTVHLGFRSTRSGFVKEWTTIHEYAHAFFEKNVLKTPELLSKFNKVWDTAVSELGALDKSVREKLLPGNYFQHRREMLDSLNLKAPETDAHKMYLSFSDTVCSLSSGKYGDGHTKSYWRKSADNPRHEFHSHTLELYFRGNPFLEKMLPQTAKAMRTYGKEVFGD